VRCEALEVLDLTDPALLEQLGLDEDDLIGDDYLACQEIAALARAAGFDGVLSPSAALPGQRTLMVFHHAMGKVQPIGPEKIRQAPPRMVDLLGFIRLHPDVPTSVRRLLWAIRNAGREAVARARAMAPGRVVEVFDVVGHGGSPLAFLGQLSYRCATVLEW
jgi:hypothetical protein